MSYQSWSVVFGEQPSAAKWNILGTNDSSFNDGTGLNDGSVQQIKYTQTGAVATGMTIMPDDDTIPQNTEGDQYMSLAITPKSATNILVIEVKAIVSLTVAKDTIGAIFQDSTAGALAAGTTYNSVNGEINTITITHHMVAGTTSATTFKFRAGPQAAGTLTFNGAGASRRYGGVAASSIRITEYKAS